MFLHGYMLVVSRFQFHLNGTNYIPMTQMCPDISVGVANRLLFPTNPFFDVVHMFDFITKAKSHKSVLMMFTYFSLVLQVGGNICYIYIYVCVCSHTHTHILCTNYKSCIIAHVYIFIYLYYNFPTIGLIIGMSPMF